MSLGDETCDYCDEPVDFTKGIERHTIPPLFWCGECTPGLLAVFGNHTDTQLRKIIEAAQIMETKLGTPEEYRVALESKENVTEYNRKFYWELLRMHENKMHALNVLGSRL